MLFTWHAHRCRWSDYAGELPRLPGTRYPRNGCLVQQDQARHAETLLPRCDVGPWCPGSPELRITPKNDSPVDYLRPQAVPAARQVRGAVHVERGNQARALVAWAGGLRVYRIHHSAA